MSAFHTTSRRVALLILALASAGCVTAGVSVEASVAAFAPSLDGDAALAGTATTGLADVDVSSDLDLDDSEIVPMPRLTFDVLGLGISVSAFQTSQSGTGNLSAAFGDIAANSRVSTDLDLTSAQGTLTFDVVNIAGFRLAPGVAVDYFDLELDVVENTLGISERLSVEAPVPLAFLQASIDVPALPVRIHGQIGGMVGSFDELEGTILDAELRIHVELSGPFELFAGYRHLSFDVDGRTDNQDFKGDFTLGGWLLGASMRF